MKNLHRLIVAFAFLASLAGAPQVFAETLYFQQVDSSGDIALQHLFGGAVIGQFTLTASTTVVSGASVNITVKSNSLPAAGPLAINVASGLSCGSAVMAFYVPLPAADAVYHIFSTTTEPSFVGNVLAPGTYTVCGDNYSTSNSTVVKSDSGSTEFYGYIQNGGTPPDEQGTRVIEPYPLNGSTIATSTTNAVGALIYVSEEDFVDGMKLRVELINQTQVKTQEISFSAAGAWDRFLGQGLYVHEFEIPEAGFVSLTIPYQFTEPGIELGRYTISTPTDFFQGLPFLGQFFGTPFTVSTSTRFTVGYKTVLDQAIEYGQQAIAEYTLTGTASTTQTTSVCQPVSGNFSVGGCVGLLFVPSAQNMQDLFSSAQAGFFTVWPFGYINRFMSIVLGDDSVELPPISYTFGSSSPAVLQGKTYSMQLFTPEHFEPLLSIRADDGSNDNVWDVINPYFQLATALSVFGVIMFDLMGLYWVGSSSRRQAGASQAIPERGVLSKQQAYNAKVAALRDSPTPMDR